MGDSNKEVIYTDREMLDEDFAEKLIYANDARRQSLQNGIEKSEAERRMYNHHIFKLITNAIKDGKTSIKFSAKYMTEDSPIYNSLKDKGFNIIREYYDNPYPTNIITDNNLDVSMYIGNWIIDWN